MPKIFQYTSCIYYVSEHVKECLYNWATYDTLMLTSIAYIECIYVTTRDPVNFKANIQAT